MAFQLKCAIGAGEVHLARGVIGQATGRPFNMKAQRGFTIVELLIVIVVIGILAAITIVAYNGIQQRAIATKVTADLSGAVKLFALHEVSAGRYPADLAEANDGQGVKASAGTTYQYTATNTTYCLTATNGTTSYRVSHDATTPVAGGCAGHGVGGALAITNFAPNPSLETNVTNWNAGFGTGGAGTVTRMTSGGNTGSAFIRQAWTTAPTSVSGGAWTHHPTNGVISEGRTYTASVYVRPSKAQRVAVWIYWLNAAGSAISTHAGVAQVAPAGVWTRLSVTPSSPAPAGTVRFFIVPWSTSGTGYVAWIAGDYMDADSVMMTETDSVTTYADGSSPNWVWNGTANVSTSTGPQL